MYVLFSLLVSILSVIGCARFPFLRSEQPLDLFRVEKLTLQGNTHFSASEIQTVMGTKEQPFWPWQEVEYFNPQVLEEDLLRIRKFYFDRGYLHTRVAKPEVTTNEEDRTVQITITIEEGEPTILIRLTFEGLEVVKGITEAELRKGIPLKEGKPLSRLQLDQSKVEILNRIRNLGYARAELSTRVEVNEEQREGRVTFTLKPGDIAYFGKTRIKGNEQVSTTFIRRGLGYKEGELFTLDKLQESQRSLFNRGLFDRVRLEPLNLDKPGEPVDILVTVREGKMRSVRAGIGYGTEDQLRLQLAWTHRNLFGGGQRFTLEGKGSFILQEVNALFQQPFFLDRFTSLNGNLTYKRDDQVSFTETRLAAGTQISRSFSPTLNGFLGYTFQFSELSDVSPEAALDLSPEALESNFLSLVSFGLQRNTADDFFNPTRGSVLSSLLEYSEPSLGSAVRFLRGSLEGKKYITLTKGVILAGRVEIGSIRPFGIEEVQIPITQRFFSGGSTSVRGFRRNRLGPLDSSDDPLGGNSLLEGSIEIRFPIYKELRGVAFLDVGNVYSDSFTFDLGDLRYAAGPGIRYNTPVGPLRFDVGFNLDPRPNEDSFVVHFSIGQAF